MDRRNFLKAALQFSAAGLIVPSFLRQGSLLWPSAAGAAEDAPFAGRILIWINYSGGNDGLNTVVPYANPIYTAARPTIGLTAEQVLVLDGETGLHPSLAGLLPIWEAGKMRIVQGVGYPNMNLSHFRGTDIWMSGSDEPTLLDTGWMARWLEAIYTDFPSWLPESPFALMQGAHRIPLNGNRGITGLVVDDPSSFNFLVNDGFPGEYGDQLPATHGGDELQYLRNLDLATFEYAAAIDAANTTGTNTVPYPQSTLGRQLEVVARMISGGLRTPVFLVSEYGFDTHSYQGTQHAALMQSIGDSIASIWQDMANQGKQDQICILTTSEFGRRVEENGSYGTDHGTAAPHFVISNGVSGGISGTSPDLANLDIYGNMQIQHDYRQMAATILGRHFGTSQPVIDSVFGPGFAPFDWMNTAADVTPLGDLGADRFFAPSPNPFRLGDRRPLELRFELSAATNVDLRVFDVRGRQVAEIGNRRYAAGAHQVQWAPENLAAGTYLLRLETPRFRKNAKVVLTP